MNAGRLASLAYLIPVVAILLGWAILDETPPALAALGGALCVVGVAIARRRPGPAAPLHSSLERASVRSRSS
jgi:drug/metabolite transporter (DMT)-like permease